MHIDKVSISNYRSFEEFNVTLNRQMNVVIGNNGAGKTAFIEAVATIASAFLLGLDGQRGFPIRKTDIRTTRFLLGNSIDEQYNLPLTIRASGSILGREFSSDDWLLELDKSNGKTKSRGIKQIKSYVGDIQRMIRNGEPVTLPLLSYYSTARLWKTKERRRNAAKKSFMRQNGYLDCMSIETDSEKMYEWLKLKTVDKIQFGNNYDVLKAVMDAIAFSLRGESSEHEIKEVWYNLATETIEVTSSDGVTMPYHFFSDGFKVVMGLVADIAYRMGVLNPHLGGNILMETPGIVIIDEIDLHLHPHWQSTILDLLMHLFPKIQFIVSTHSPMVINSVRKENLISLALGKKEPLSHYYEVYGSDASSILKTTMGVDDRPKNIVAKINRVYQLLDDEQYDDCDRALSELEEEVEATDSELLRLRTALEFNRNQI